MLGAKGIDKKSYISLVTENKEMMYRVAFGYLRNETKALDAVDEAVYLGYVHSHELKEPKFLKTWLTRILINECYKILRKDKREVIMELLPEETYNIADDSLSLKLAVQNLPEDLRKIIVLRYFGGYTISETAEIIEIPEGTVATRTRKALGILRVEISE
ncbi:MAG: polymerase sigma factor, sigma-70 family [Bacillota bacterium]|jgi:RNA polymerase sigma-70 factor (ECF subfamily)|nr:polymerase sigma factor, sigma-70 family [Bacillota bacterium]